MIDNTAQKQKTFIALKRGDAEIEWAWQAVDGGSRSRQCPCCYEVWQYMGTWFKDGSWFHNFRHRHHPATGERMYRNITARDDFQLANSTQPMEVGEIYESHLVQ